MVALTGVEPAGGQPWPVHLGLSGAFSVLVVWRNWQNTRHGRLWRCPNGARCAFQHARKGRQPWRTGGARRAAGGGAHSRKTKPCCRQLARQNWPTFARVGATGATTPPSGRTAPGCRRRRASGVVAVSLAVGSTGFRPRMDGRHPPLSASPGEGVISRKATGGNFASGVRIEILRN